MVDAVYIAPYPRKEGEETPAAPKWDVLGTVVTVVGLMLIAAALTLAAYPLIQSIRGEIRANNQFTAEMETVSVYDQDEVDRLIANAEDYNKMIAGVDGVTDVVLYDDQLEYENSHIFCWLDIPSLNIKMPVYRDDGTDEVTPNGAEHVRGTSLPVGGIPSNCVITAHSGAHEGVSMAFNKLEQLEHDDLIILWTYGRPYAYRVTGYEQTAPEATEQLEITDMDADELTLLTCRPIGTTAKRLFVHATRTEYDPETAPASRIEILSEPDFPLFVGALIGSGILVWLILLAAWRKKTVWKLDRVLGEREIAHEEILDAAKDESMPEMRLELRAFRKAKLYLFGGKIDGKWKRVKDDRSKITLQFDHNAMGDSIVECAEGYPDIRLPRGAFEAQALDEELAIHIDYHASTLVFRQNDQDDEEEEAED